MTCDRAHGRDELRTIKVLPAPPGLGFPDPKRVMLIERYVTDRKTGKQSAVAVLAVTSAAHSPAVSGGPRPTAAD
jgi:hypothetical protein